MRLYNKNIPPQSGNALQRECFLGQVLPVIGSLGGSKLNMALTDLVGFFVLCPALDKGAVVGTQIFVWEHTLESLLDLSGFVFVHE